MNEQKNCFQKFISKFKVVANKDFEHSRKWILTYEICNAVVLDHLFQF